MTEAAKFMWFLFMIHDHHPLKQTAGYCVINILVAGLHGVLSWRHQVKYNEGLLGLGERNTRL